MTMVKARSEATVANKSDRLRNSWSSKASKVFSSQELPKPENHHLIDGFKRYLNSESTPPEFVHSMAVILKPVIRRCSFNLQSTVAMDMEGSTLHTLPKLPTYTALEEL